MQILYWKKKIFAIHFILATRFILANTILLSLIFFVGGTVNVVSVSAKSSSPAPTTLSFASVSSHAFEVGFLFNVGAYLKVFAGGEIRA